MSPTFTIPGRLPSLNEYISACNRAWFIGESFKKKQMRLIGTFIQAARVPAYTRPITVYFKWIERDKRRDRDNIRSAEKYVMDALKNTRRIKNDTRKWVLDSFHEIAEDPTNPRVEVTIVEQPEAQLEL